MTLPLLRVSKGRQRRRRILDVTNHWRVDGPVPLREVEILDYDGQRRRTYLPEAHPAIAAFFDRIAA